MKPILFPLATGLRLFPDAVHGEVIARIANHLLKGQYIRDDLAYLEGKRLCIAITDTANRLTFQVAGGTLRRCSVGQTWDVRISGRLEDFWKLATRAEDPDTLFFNRHLSIEGDTDSGLYLKNLLDSMDFDMDAHLEEVVGRRWAPLVRGWIERSGLPSHVRRLTHSPF